MAAPARSGATEAADLRAVQEEIWALPLTHPTLAYVVHPVAPGPFPLVVMNHGVSLNARERSFFPLVEFRDAALWFARRGNFVVAPTGSGYGAAALDIPERGLSRCGMPSAWWSRDGIHRFGSSGATCWPTLA